MKSPAPWERRWWRRKPAGPRWRTPCIERASSAVRARSTSLSLPLPALVPHGHINGGGAHCWRRAAWWRVGVGCALNAGQSRFTSTPVSHAAALACSRSSGGCLRRCTAADNVVKCPAWSRFSCAEYWTQCWTHGISSGRGSGTDFRCSWPRYPCMGYAQRQNGDQCRGCVEYTSNRFCAL